ncbi:MAG: glycoside hydrolase family 127 protein [Oscillospiraceae bacterium]|jgi:DUF1680 family protein|nr:glycoside hydrolase family 127 protein [Oscillospiraceae bacterium]
MKKMLSLAMAFVMALALVPAAPPQAAAAEGEIVFDEATFLARYPLAGDANDTQRNQRHAALSGTGATFVADTSSNSFGTVLQLSGGSKGTGAVVLPGDAVFGFESGAPVNNITVATWVYPRANTNYARIFDFGTGTTRNFYLEQRRSNSSGVTARFTVGGSGAEAATPNGSFTMSPNTWYHVAVAVEGRAMRLYVDGVLRGQTTIPADLSSVFSTTPANNLLYIGRSQYGDNDMNGRFSDFAVFNRALTADEINYIRNLKFTDENVAASDLSMVVSGLGTLTNRTENFTLPATTASGSAVVWTSSNDALVNAETGVVTRPPSSNPNQTETAVLHVKVTKGEAVAERDVTVTVLKLPSDEEIVAGDKAALTLETGLLTEDIALPGRGALGSTVTWTSSAPQYLSETGAVTRPAVGADNEPVTLTATIEFGAASDTKTFDFVVKAAVDVPVLLGVPEVDYTARTGELPRLPYYVNGIYAGGVNGPQVRVSWSTLAVQNTNTAEINKYQSPGVNTVAGTVYGANGVTAFAVTAHVTTVEANNDSQIWVTRTLREGVAPSATVTVNNTTAGSYRTNAIDAIYDADGRFVRLAVEPFAIDPGEEESVRLALPEVDDVAGLTQRVFVWDDETNVPLDTDLFARENDDPELELAKFPYSDVVLENNPDGSTPVLKGNTERMINGLLNCDDDRFLYLFRYTFSLDTKGASALGGWDTVTTKLRGHATGHYLSALAQAYLSTARTNPAQHERFEEKIDYMVDELYAISQLAQGDPADIPVGPGKTAYTTQFATPNMRTDYENWGEGFISAYPPDSFIMLERGATYGSTDAQIWAPYYTLHKILAGLVDCYEATGNEKALAIATGMGIWVYRRLSTVPQATLNSMWNRYIAGEYGGMNEVMARMYDITGDERLLAGAKLFDTIDFFFGSNSTLGSRNGTNGMAGNVDTIRTKHANQHLPQIVGTMREYDATGDIKYYQITRNFWEKAVNSYSYSMGGVAGYTGNSEAFVATPDILYQPGTSGPGIHGGTYTGNGDMCEGCATYNMLKISSALFQHDPDAKYMDYYERALYNQIAAIIQPTGVGTVYHFAQTPGAAKSYGNTNLTGFSCCNGTGIENHTKYQDSIYMRKGDDELYVNLYIPSTLYWKDGLTVRQSTGYPNSDTTTLTVAGGGDFALNLRIPYWASNGFAVLLNGEPLDIAADPSSYVVIDRVWSDGDTVTLTIPMDFHIFETINRPNIASVLYGPIVLAASETAVQPTFRKVTLDGADLSNSIAIDPSTLTAQTNGVTLKPLYTYNTQRYSTYLDIALEK